MDRLLRFVLALVALAVGLATIDDVQLTRRMAALRPPVQKVVDLRPEPLTPPPPPPPPPRAVFGGAMP